nr:MAG TPA: hypothetical protein [Caudoviricetes sp.]
MILFSTVSPRNKHTITEKEYRFCHKCNTKNTKLIDYFCIVPYFEPNTQNLIKTRAKFHFIILHYNAP